MTVMHCGVRILLCTVQSHICVPCPACMRAVWKVRGLTLLPRVGTLWKCGDGLFFEVPTLASDVLLTTLHPLLENVLQPVCHKLQEDSGTGGFDLLITSSSELPFHGLIASSP
jgi:hypothetical protein